MNVEQKALLLGRDGRPSLKAVYSGMNTGSLYVRRRFEGKEYMRKYSNNNVKTLERVPVQGFRNSIIVRWGNRIELPLDNCIVYNKSEAIANATDKKKSRIMLEKAGVTIPKLVSPNNIDSKDFPIIARPSTHSKGKNIVVLKTQDEFLRHYNQNERNGWYYSAFVNKDRELRFHFGHGKIIAVMEKPAPRDKNQVAWNRAQVGEEWNALKWSEFVAAWCKKALDAGKALGLDFGSL